MRNPAWNLSHRGRRMLAMEILTTIGAILAGIVLVTVGMFSLAAIWFDDLI